jgi:hypothetical protein
MLARVGDKWTVVVVGVLAHGPMRDDDTLNARFRIGSRRQRYK